MTQASAPGKIILFGEHAVVYGRPAIAVPLPSIRASVEVDALPPKERNGIQVHAPALGTTFLLDEVDRQEPLGLAIHLAIETLQVTYPPNLRMTISSEIPISAGLGSGAAVTVAIIRCLCRHFGRSLSNEKISELAYEVECIYHGTPSGVDNTVISYEKPVYFRKDREVKLFNIQDRFTLLLAHSGQTSSTGEVVRGVRERWEDQQNEYERIFDSIERIVDLAYSALQRGDISLLGPLMDQNQNHLASLRVSSPMLDNLIVEARAAGATGAKLSGAGQGGFMITLVEPGNIETVRQALQSAGAAQVLETTI
jgi:mevalonate kinase